MKPLPSLCFLLALSCTVPGLQADVKLPAIISDHMVLKKSERVPIWGKADPGEEVTVSLAGQTAKTRTGEDGKWAVALDLKAAGAGPFEMLIEGKNKLTLTDVVVGEVWVASGQSNMEWVVTNTLGAEAEIAGSANPLLRQFLVKKAAVPSPLDDTAGSWVSASPETTGGFSAVGYFFAKKLQSELKSPVGIINTSWGGTPSEAWTSAEALATVPDLKSSSERLWAGAKEEHLKMAKAEHEFPASDQKGTALAPQAPKSVLAPQNTAAFLYNGMIAPILPYAISGAIWYQGESNAGRSVQYRTAFPLLITDWRKQWGQGDFPFYFCQLANFMPKSSTPEDSGWAELREAQSLTLKLPNTGQAVLIDIGEAADIHPRNKQDVGDRLARIALAKDYGQTIPFSGPVYESMKVENGKVRLGFSQTSGGLVATPLGETHVVKSQTGETAPLVRNSPGSPLEGFAICGEDKTWVWADAKIDGNDVIVWSDRVPAPVAVRYAWANNPTCNLANGAGLPASPFRTDSFPATTEGKSY